MARKKYQKIVIKPPVEKKTFSDILKGNSNISDKLNNSDNQNKKDLCIDKYINTNVILTVFPTMSRLTTFETFEYNNFPNILVLYDVLMETFETMGLTPNNPLILYNFSYFLYINNVNSSNHCSNHSKNNEMTDECFDIYNQYINALKDVKEKVCEVFEVSEITKITDVSEV